MAQDIAHNIPRALYIAHALPANDMWQALLEYAALWEGYGSLEFANSHVQVAR